MYVVTVHAKEAYMGGRDKVHSCLTSMLDEDSVSTFTTIKGFYRGGEKKLKFASYGNWMMRLTLDVAIQILVKRDENNYFLRKCNFWNINDNKLTVTSHLLVWLLMWRWFLKRVGQIRWKRWMTVKKQLERMQKEGPLQDTSSTLT